MKVKVSAFKIFTLSISLISILLFNSIGYTLAYYHSENSFINSFNTNSYSSTSWEVFQPPTSWNGKEINKDIFVENTSTCDTPQFLRVRFTEQLIGSDGNVYSIVDCNGIDLISKIWDSTTGLYYYNGTINNCWTKIGEWYYYNYPLNKGQQIKILDSIKSEKCLKDCTYILTFEIETTSTDEKEYSWSDISMPNKNTDGSYYWR